MENFNIEPNYFQMHLKVLRFFGANVIPIEGVIKRFLYWIYAVMLFSFLISMTILEFIEIFFNSRDLSTISFGLAYFVTHVLGTAKMLIVVIQRNRLWRQCQKMEEGFFKPNIYRGGIKEYQLIKMAIRSYNRQGLYCYCFVVIVLSSLAVSITRHNVSNLNPNLNITIHHAKELPFKTFTPFKYNLSPIYELVAGTQLLWALVYGIIIAAVDALICGFMMLLKAQFLILKEALNSLIERAEAQATRNIKLPRIKHFSNTFSQNIYYLSEETLYYAQKFAEEIVMHHQQLISFCDETENLFSYLMLMQFLSSLYIICFALFQLSMLDFGSFGFLSMACYMLIMTFQIFCYCWHGNEVNIESGNLSDYVYQIDWFKMNRSVNRCLLMVMMRSQRPFQFSAGKFAFLSLPTFVAIVRASGSYFMVLRQMNGL